MKRFGWAMVCLVVLYVSCSIKEVFAEIDVEAAYKTVCVLCHGEDGKGSSQGKKFKVPDFTDKEWQAGVSDEEMIKRMIEGSDNPNYDKGVIPLLEMIGIEDPKSIVPAFIPIVRGFAR